MSPFRPTSREPDVIDDVVDELVELVISRGGWIALLADGTLPAGTGWPTLRSPEAPAG